MTKYLSDKYATHPKDIITIGNDWTEDYDNTEYSCKYCRRIMHKTKIIDSSGQNPSYSVYCASCGILSEVEEDTRKKSKVKVHKGKVTDANLGVAYVPEKTIARKKTEPKGTFRMLQERGIKITNY